MNRFISIAAAVAGMVLLSSCSKDIQNQDAVRQGVMSYLSKRSDLLAMDVSVASVSFQKDEATAQVHFQAKGNSSPGAGMTMAYLLDRKDGQWVVRSKTGANASHGANPTVNGPSALPGSGAPGPLDGMPALPGSGTGGGAGSLPPGHPSVSGGAQGLPPGHPAINPNSTNEQK